VEAPTSFTPTVPRCHSEALPKNLFPNYAKTYPRFSKIVENLVETLTLLESEPRMTPSSSICTPRKNTSAFSAIRKIPPAPLSLNTGENLFFIPCHSDPRPVIAERFHACHSERSEESCGHINPPQNDTRVLCPVQPLSWLSETHLRFSEVPQIFKVFCNHAKMD